MKFSLHSLSCPKIFAISLIFLASWNQLLWANDQQDPDQQFYKAWELAVQGEYQAARDITDQILANFPDYHDASILKARTLAWEKDFQAAREILLEVREKAPRHKDALYALIDVEMWSENYKDAIKLIDIALQDQPNNTQWLFKKALAMHETGDETAAVVLLNQILDIDPSHKEAHDLLNSIDARRLKNFIGLGYRGHYFEENSPWHLAYLELGRKTRTFGPVIARVNAAERFSNQGIQFEIDAYPSIQPGTYLYLNAGYSPDSDLFPTTRFGFELFQTIPSAWEISAGFRLLNFESKDITILTGSINKYYRKYYFSFRPYFSFSSNLDEPNNQSYFLTARRFFSSPDHYLSITLGRGYSADFDRVTGGHIYDIGGTLFEVMMLYQQNITNRLLYRIGAGYKIYDTDRSTVPWGNPIILEAGIINRF